MDINYFYDKGYTYEDIIEILDCAYEENNNYIVAVFLKDLKDFFEKSVDKQ
jgi:hypothetical protein